MPRRPTRQWSAAGEDDDFTFTKTVSSSATTFNDVATATYTDEATEIPVPGNTHGGGLGDGDRQRHLVRCVGRDQ